MRNEIMVWIFSAPGAVSFFKLLDDRIELTPILEKIVLNFEKVSDGFWLLVAKATGVNFDRFSDLLTFVCLILLPVLTQYILNLLNLTPQNKALGIDGNDQLPGTSVELYKAKLEELNEKELELNSRFIYWAITFFFLYYALYIFNLSGLIIPFILVGMSLEYVKKFYKNGKEADSSLMRTIHYLGGLLWVLILIIFTPLLFRSILVSSDVNAYSDINWIYFAVGSYFLSFLFFRATDYCHKSIGKIGLMTVGIWLFNWISVVAIPQINQFFESIGV